MKSIKEIMIYSLLLTGFIALPLFVLGWIWFPEYSWGKMIATDVLILGCIGLYLRASDV